MRIDLAETGKAWAPASRGPDGARLLMVTQSVEGFAAGRLSVARAAQAAGYEVHLAAPLDAMPPRAEIEAAGLAFHDMDVGQSTAKPGGRMTRFAAFDRLIRRLKPDLLHCVGLRSVLQGGAVARLRRLPAVLSLPSLDGGAGEPKGGSLLRRAFRLSALAFAFGNDRASVVLQEAEDRIRFVRMRALDSRRAFLLRGAGIDLAQFHPCPAGARKAGPPVMLLAGDSASPADVRRFAAAGRRLGARAIVFGSEICGALCNVEASLERWGPGDDVAHTLRQADVIVVPVPQSPVSARLMAEATATGVPIVAAAQSRPPRLLRSGLNGLLVPAGDGPALEAALERLFTEPALRDTMGQRAREMAEAELSLQSYLTASLAIYRATLEAPALKRARRRAQ